MSSNLIPRLPSSTTWTELPAEFTAKIKTIFDDQFKVEAGYGEFLIEGRIYPHEIALRVGFIEEGRLKQINFEASMDLRKSDEVPAALNPDPEEASAPRASQKNGQSKTMDLIYVCIDALGSAMEEYFELEEGTETDIPLYWDAYDFEGEKVYLKHSTINTRLEAEADRILGLLENSLLMEEAESEDALAKAEVDNDLAAEVQKIIRSGKYPKSAGAEWDDENPNDAH